MRHCYLLRQRGKMRVCWAEGHPVRVHGLVGTHFACHEPVHRAILPVAGLSVVMPWHSFCGISRRATPAAGVPVKVQHPRVSSSAERISPMAEKSLRGFAAMDQEKQRAIASKGGKAAHAKGTAHEFTPEEARAAGRKGGQAAHAKGTAHEFTPEEAREAGRKGGQSSHSPHPTGGDSNTGSSGVGSSSGGHESSSGSHMQHSEIGLSQGYPEQSLQGR